MRPMKLFVGIAVLLASEVQSQPPATLLGYDHTRYCNPSACRCDPPLWSVQANSLFLERAQPDSQVIMFDTGNPARNINADEYDFGFQAGYEVAATLNRGSGRSWEARWMSIDGWDALHTDLVGGPANIQFHNSPPTSAPSVTRVDSRYDSELTSFEWNVRQCVTDCVTMLGGFRYVELDEDFGSAFDAALAPSTFSIATRNRLYGGQLGLESRLFCGECWSVDGKLKLGLLANRSSQNAVYDTGATPVTANGRSRRVSFLGELGISARRRMTRHLDFVAGYQLMWLETVALATDQFNATNLTLGTGIDADGGAFYHGAMVGLEYRH